jgi:nucleotide-binding universal stress UspA family protein
MKVLACVDTSQSATSVCEYAAWSAMQLGASVEVLHVIEQRPIMVGVPDHSGRLGIDTGDALLAELAEIDERRNKVAHEIGRALIDHAAQRIREAGVSRVTQRLLDGDFVRQLGAHSADASFVVIGRYGETIVTPETHMGIHLERVTRSIGRPILVAPPTFSKPESYVFAYDAGRSAGAATNFLAESSFLKNLRGQMLLVAAPGSSVISHQHDAARHLRATGYAIEEVVRDGEPDDVIVDYLEQEKIDLLVMGAYGHSRLRAFLVGSTTMHLIDRTRIPILIVK